jgi:hypothetical protein
VRSNADLAIEHTAAYSRTIAYLRLAWHASACERAPLFHERSAVIRSNTPVLRSNALAKPATFCASVRTNALTCARAHLSCCSSRPEAVYVTFFLVFFVYLIISFNCLFIIPVFSCLIFVFSFCSLLFLIV